MSALLVVMDLLAITISFLVAFYLRRLLGGRGIIFEPLVPNLSFYANFWPTLLLWPLVLWREGLYPGLQLTAPEELRRLLGGTTIASLLVITLTFVSQTGAAFSRPILVGWWLVTIGLLPIHHIGTKLVLSFVGATGPPAVILGANETVARVIRVLRKQYVPPLHPVAVFGDPPEGGQGHFAGIPIEGNIGDAAEWARRHSVDIALVVLPDLPNDELVALVESLGRTFRRLLVVPNLAGLSTAETSVRDFEGVLALEVRKNLLSTRSQAVKRAVDLALSASLLVLLSPLYLALAVALALERQGSVLYGHRRLGRHSTEFTAWKFRTMVREADQVLARALQQDAGLQAEWEAARKLARDPRLTPVGRFLRRFSLDELPQLWNVLRAEMSLVGPRPIVAPETEKYGRAIDLYFQVRPGLTGLWQVSGRSSLTYEERVRLDTYYVRNWSLWLDLVILLRTFLAVLTGRGAY